jgi:hypothetical protein
VELVRVLVRWKGKEERWRLEDGDYSEQEVDIVGLADVQGLLAA